MTDLVDLLVDLDEDEVRNLLKARAERRAERHRRIESAVRHLRQTILAGFSGRKAARVIEDVARRRRQFWRDPELRSAVEQQLIAELGDLKDIPQFERIRQLLEIE